MSYTKTTHHTAYPSISPSRPELSIANKVILITGGGSGLGKHAASAFAEAGAQAVALLGRRQTHLEAAAQALQASHPSTKVLTYAVDVLNLAELRQAVTDLVGSAGPIDVVVHCAGALGALEPVADASSSSFWSAMEINIRGTLHVAQAVLPHLAAVDPVFLPLTTAGLVAPPFPGMAAYLAGKAAALKLVECFAAENPGVRVVSVHPGLIRTEMAEALETAGIQFPYDDASLPSGFLVWVATKRAAFLKGKFVFAGWDVDELEARGSEIQDSGDLAMGLRLHGFP